MGTELRNGGAHYMEENRRVRVLSSYVCSLRFRCVIFLLFRPPPPPSTPPTSPVLGAAYSVTHLRCIVR